MVELEPFDVKEIVVTLEPSGILMVPQMGMVLQLFGDPD